MEEGIIIQNQNLPNNIEDLAKFVLVGAEKLTAVRAEIRAIDKLQLAKDVKMQKEEEAQMLAEALLDAKTKIGDLLKKIPKAIKGNQYTGKMVSDTSVANQKTKKQVIEELGFNKKQAERFETLSSNKDIVEQVKAEARENDDIPTTTRVLQLVKQKSKEEQFLQEEFKKIENKTAIKNNYHNALFKILTLDIRDEEACVWIDSMLKSDKDRLNQDIDEAINKLNQIREIFRNYNQMRRIK